MDLLDANTKIALIERRLEQYVRDGWKPTIRRKGSSYYLVVRKKIHGKRVERHIAPLSGDILLYFQKKLGKVTLNGYSSHEPSSGTSSTTTSKVEEREPEPQSREEHRDHAMGVRGGVGLCCENGVGGLLGLLGVGGCVGVVGVHGLVLFVCGVPRWGVVGGWGWGRCTGGVKCRVFRFVFPSKRGWVEAFQRVVRFEFYPRTGCCRIYVACDNEPLSYEEWKALKVMIENYVYSIYERVTEFRVLRFEVSCDEELEGSQKLSVDIPRGLTVTLKEMDDWLERVYVKEKKDGTKVLRKERIYGGGDRTLEDLEEELKARSDPVKWLREKFKVLEVIAENLGQVVNVASGMLSEFQYMRELEKRIARLENLVSQIADKIMFSETKKEQPSHQTSPCRTLEWGQLPDQVRNAIQLLAEVGAVNYYNDRIEYGALVWRMLRKKTGWDRIMRLVGDLVSGEPEGKLALQILEAIRFYDNKEPCLRQQGLSGITYSTLIKRLKEVGAVK